MKELNRENFFSAKRGLEFSMRAKFFQNVFGGAAIIAQTSVAYMVLSFFVNGVNPEFPMKAFADAETTKHWLTQLKK